MTDPYTPPYPLGTSREYGIIVSLHDGAVAAMRGCSRVVPAGYDAFHHERWLLGYDIARREMSLADLGTEMFSAGFLAGAAGYPAAPPLGLDPHGRRSWISGQETGREQQTDALAKGLRGESGLATYRAGYEARLQRRPRIVPRRYAQAWTAIKNWRHGWDNAETEAPDV